MSRRSRLTLALALALGARGAFAQAADTSARPITLQEAVQLAQRNNPSAVAARGQERTSAAALRSARYAFIPSLSLSASGARQLPASKAQTRINANGEVVTIATDPWSFNNGLGFNVQLFDGGSRFANLATARANVEAADVNTVAQGFRVRLDVAQQFFNALAARESEAAARAQLEQARQQLSAATARVKAGVATVSDSLRSVIQVGNAQLALLTAQNNLVVANATLTRLVGTPFQVTAAATDTAARPLALPDSAELNKLAEEGPAVRQAEAAAEASRASYKAARAPLLPTLNASYNYSGTGTDRYFGLGNADPFNYSGALRFSLSYPIFNQGQREESITRASVARENAEATLRDARLAAQQSLVQYLGALRTAEQRVAIQQASVAAAQEDLRVQQQRYSLGASTLLDLLTSQSQLNSAQAALIQARYDYRVARAQLEALIGREL